MQTQENLTRVRQYSKEKYHSFYEFHTFLDAGPGHIFCGKEHSESLMIKYIPKLIEMKIFIKEKYNLDDNICNAIKYHTIGNKNMDLLAKIIYIADKIGREKIPEALKPVKELAYQNINKALLYCLEKQKIRLKEKGIKIHDDTEELLKELQK